MRLLCVKDFLFSDNLPFLLGMRCTLEENLNSIIHMLMSNDSAYIWTFHDTVLNLLFLEENITLKTLLEASKSQQLSCFYDIALQPERRLQLYINYKCYSPNTILGGVFMTVGHHHHVRFRGLHRQPSRLLGGGRMTTSIVNMKNNNRHRNLKRKGWERTNLSCKESNIL